MVDKRTGVTIDENGDKVWRLDGDIHRTDGPAIEFANGDRNWCLYNKLHREDGPAIDNLNGIKCWLLDDHFHRTDGPAIERPNGEMCWYFYGRKLSFEKWLDQTPDITDEEKVMFKLQYG
jgi:hypothetical protein